MPKQAVLSAAFLVASFSQAVAQISVTCTPLAASDTNDPIVSIDVSVDRTKWSIVHNSAAGNHYQRSQQYDLSDATHGTTPAWKGSLRGRPYIIMQGKLVRNGSELSYKETLNNLKTGNVVTNASRCEPSPNETAKAAGQRPEASVATRDVQVPPKPQTPPSQESRHTPDQLAHRDIDDAYHDMHKAYVSQSPCTREGLEAYHLFGETTTYWKTFTYGPFELTSGPFWVRFHYSFTEDISYENSRSGHHGGHPETSGNYAMILPSEIANYEYVNHPAEAEYRKMSYRESPYDLVVFCKNNHPCVLGSNKWVMSGSLAFCNSEARDRVLHALQHIACEGNSC